MSTYLYTLRSQTIRAKDETGLSRDPLEIALFSFVTGNLGGWDGPSRHESACETLAVTAWEKLSVDGKVPFVVHGDKEDLAELRSGKKGYLTVYRGCTSARWVDTSPFPAEEVYGLLVKDGGRLAVRSAYVEECAIEESDSKSMMNIGQQGGWVPTTGSRTEIIDGKVIETIRRFGMPDGRNVWARLDDTAARELIAEEWAPVWAREEAKKVKQEADGHRRRALTRTRNERQELDKEILELRTKLTDASRKLTAKLAHENILKQQIERAV